MEEKKYPCECCGELTIEDESVTLPCPVCGWENDSWGEAHPDEEAFPNPCSLNEARRLFKQYGDDIRNHFEKGEEPEGESEEEKAKWFQQFVYGNKAE